MLMKQAKQKMLELLFLLVFSNMLLLEWFFVDNTKTTWIIPLTYQGWYRMAKSLMYYNANIMAVYQSNDAPLSSVRISGGPNVYISAQVLTIGV